MASPTLSLRCSSRGEPDERGGPASNGFNRGRWDDFLGAAPPKLGKDEVGVDVASQPYDKVPTHAYVWGPRGADWTRAGWWQVRWEDRFAAGNGIRVSSNTRPPWGDEVTAGDAIGARRGGGVWRWDTVLEPAGDAALVVPCGAGGCYPQAVSQGRPVMPLRSPQGGPVVFRGKLTHGVARIGESWYLLSDETEAAPLTLWRASLGVMRHIASFRRIDAKRFRSIAGAPQLVRRRLGNELGLLIDVPPDPSTGESAGEWMVLPIDTSDGSLGEPVSLGRSDPTAACRRAARIRMTDGCSRRNCR